MSDVVCALQISIAASTKTNLHVVFFLLSYLHTNKLSTWCLVNLDLWCPVV